MNMYSLFSAETVQGECKQGDIRPRHRITEWQGLEGTSVGHLVQPSCRSRVTYSRLHRSFDMFMVG